MQKNYSLLLISAVVVASSLISCKQPTSGNSSASLSVSTLAGSSTSGNMIGSGTEARFNTISDLVLDADGNLYVADYSNSVIRRVTAAGDVTNYADLEDLNAGTSNPQSVSLDSDGNVYEITQQNAALVTIHTSNDGGLTSASRTTDDFGSTYYSNPQDIFVDKNGYIYLADEAKGCVLYSPGSTYAKSYVCDEGNFDCPSGMAMSADGDLYVADSDRHVIYKIAGPTAVMSVFAGRLNSSGYTDGTGTEAKFNAPSGLDFSDGYLYVADQGNRRIRRINIETGVVATYAGNGDTGTVNGALLSASFTAPSDLAVDSDGTVYVADGHCIRKISM